MESKFSFFEDRNLIIKIKIKCKVKGVIKKLKIKSKDNGDRCSPGSDPIHRWSPTDHYQGHLVSGSPFTNNFVFFRGHFRSSSESGKYMNKLPSREARSGWSAVY